MEASAFRGQRAPVLPGSRRLLAALGDDRLVEQVRRGNAVAFEVIYDRHYRGILSFCRHMLGSPEEAEDAVQQTFASAFTDLQSNDRDIRLKAWLYTIARNRCLSVLRNRREQAVELTAEDLPTAGLSEQVQQRADLKELLHDLRELPDDQREALVLFEIGDLSQAEVANVIGVEPVKVKALVFQARSALIENREARAIPCAEIREQLATASGGELRRGPLRRHLKACDGCAEYRDEVRAQRRALAMVLPVVPTVGLKQSVLAAIGFGGGAGGGGLAAGGGVATGAAGVGSSAAGGSGAAGFLASFGGMGAAKLVIAATLGTGALVGGGVAVERAVDHDGGPDSAQAAEGSGDEGATGDQGGGSPGNGSPALIGTAIGDSEGKQVDEKSRGDDKGRDDDRKSGDDKSDDEGDGSGKGEDKRSGRSGGDNSKGESRRQGNRSRGRSGRRGTRRGGSGQRGHSGTPRGNSGNRGSGSSGNSGSGGTSGGQSGVRAPVQTQPAEPTGSGGAKGGRSTAGTPVAPAPAGSTPSDAITDDSAEKLLPDAPLSLSQ